MNEEDCEGCVISDFGSCPFLNNHIPCPCQQCLVKVMCVTSCELLKDHSAKLKIRKPKRLDRR